MCAKQGVKLFLEHKNSEPAMKIFMRNVGMTLHVIHTLRAQGIRNVQVNMDWQHLIMNGESLGEYAALLAAEGLLGHQHANSGWGTFDDDNMVGATAFMETLELALELKRAGYGDNGERLGFDLYPYTEDAVAAVKRSVLQWNYINQIAHRIDDTELRKAQASKGRRPRLRTRLHRTRRVSRARLAVSQRLGQHRPCVHGDGFAVGNEHPLDRQIEKRRQSRAQSHVVDPGREPRLGAQAQSTSLTPENDVARHEGRVLGNPVDDLGGAAARERHNASRQRLTRPEDVGDRIRPALNRSAGAAWYVQPRAVAADNVRGASRMPEHRDQDVNRHSRAFDIPVERLPEPCRLRLVGWHERIDQDDGVARLVVDAPDVVAPLLVVGRPAPETVGDREDLHGARAY